MMMRYTVLLFLPVLLVAGWSQPDSLSERPETQHVTAERFHFTPSRIKVKEGETVDLVLTSQDTFHGFYLPAGDLKVTIPARGRGSVVVRFRADSKGEYPFECSRPCGAGHTMMRGVILVE